MCTFRLVHSVYTFTVFSKHGSPIQHTNHHLIINEWCRITGVREPEFNQHPTPPTTKQMAADKVMYADCCTARINTLLNMWKKYYEEQEWIRGICMKLSPWICVHRH